MSSLEPFYAEVSCEGTTCRIGQPLIDAVLSSPEAVLAEGTSLSFAEVDGEAVGLRLHGVEPNGLAARLGLHEDDLVLTVDGQPLTTEDELLDAATRMMEADEVVISIQCGGDVHPRTYIRLR